MCPRCQSTEKCQKAGTYIRKADQKSIQRFLCPVCKTRFSSQTNRIDYRYRKRHLDQVIFRALCKGTSQRALAFLLGVKPATIARRITRFGPICAKNLEHMRQTCQIKDVMIDEMESFEHTKCKPLTMPIAVEKETRRILALDCGQIAAKGHLAKIARKKYGFRKCERDAVLTNVFSQLRACTAPDARFYSDQSKHYPKHIKRYFPQATTYRYKGRRGCVVGQGELKAGGFDPLFSLNHTYAMFRDNLKRLSRRTWCTTKVPAILKDLMHMYAWFHNLKLEGDRGILRCLTAN